VNTHRVGLGVVTKEIEAFSDELSVGVINLAMDCQPLIQPIIKLGDLSDGYLFFLLLATLLEQPSN
jgi:predicted ATPase